MDRIVSAEDVRQLRMLTGLGMMECKRALQATAREGFLFHLQYELNEGHITAEEGLKKLVDYMLPEPNIGNNAVLQKYLDRWRDTGSFYQPTNEKE